MNITTMTQMRDARRKAIARGKYHTRIALAYDLLIACMLASFLVAYILY